ncbi:hypothetical protein [Couchioplanes azureus]|uniref:hypothetical protein n=1 Tax=Couchioplanes caeruleus TaxID=56438 RepID=UPI001670C808|nr:hypothetical protein [Couchioplanes caeruleus]GGQ88294.1 hypothetical protein GCM10010166_67830 [Couchioplanes caeruleus subsp. azureus]
MGIFGGKKQEKSTYKPIPSNAKTEAEWRRWEQNRGCSFCGKKGCDRTKHSCGPCGSCGSLYCNGDACPGPKHAEHLRRMAQRQKGRR